MQCPFIWHASLLSNNWDAYYREDLYVSIYQVATNFFVCFYLTDCIRFTLCKRLHSPFPFSLILSSPTILLFDPFWCPNYTNNEKQLLVSHVLVTLKHALLFYLRLPHIEVTDSYFWKKCVSWISHKYTSIKQSSSNYKL